MSSEYAVQDVFDAIEYVKREFEIDEDNIFLLGLSGGGHAISMEAAFAWLLSQYKKENLTAVTG